MHGEPHEKRTGRAREIEALVQRYGAPLTERIEIGDPNLTSGPAGFPVSSRRTAEVVLVVPRQPGTVLVHTKSFYPSGIWRLPTGGLRRRESIETAVRREIAEETGQTLEPRQFLFHLHFVWHGVEKEFHSYGFLLSRSEGTIRSRDRREQIAAFRDLDRRGIQVTARRLESLAGRWSAWGRFRAAPHRALLRVWNEGDLLSALPQHGPADS